MRTPNAIDNNADVIDSRDIIARLEYLTERREDEDKTDPLDDDEEAEFLALSKFAQDAEHDVSEWEDGAMLVRDSYFKEYAQQLADDLGMIDHNLSWPHSCIDWDMAARELQQDYSCLSFDGVDYWSRS